jgi:hypothetical protein
MWVFATGALLMALLLAYLTVDEFLAERPQTILQWSQYGVAAFGLTCTLVVAVRAFF